MSKKNKKKKTSSVQICIYIKNKNGNGGVVLENKTKLPIYIADSRENFALDGDTVEIIYKHEGKTKLVGEVTKILTHKTLNLIGIIFRHKDRLLLKVQNQKFGNYLVCVDESIGSDILFKADELFNTVITVYPTADKPFFVVKVVNSLGLLGEDKAFIAQTIIEANVPTEFSMDAINQAKKPRDKILVRDLKERLDLRDLPFVTIDGEDAKDFDDAVYCELSNNNEYVLYVAIADVAHFVTHESPLDIEAYNRGASIYFPRQVIPMLPERLSNELCSLNPYKDRLVICCKINIDSNGLVTKYELANAIIKSHARLTYNQVQEWINNNKKIPADLKKNIINLYSIYKTLLSSRNVRGAIDFETEEPYFEFDSKGLVTNIKARVRVDSHKLIEECMLVANVCVADFMLKSAHPSLFRIHEKPSEEKFNALKAYLNSMAIDFDIKYEQLVPLDYLNLLNSVKNHAQFKAIQQVVLRSMQLAIYSPNNVGHFGLSYAYYLHFTSPIRRYPDLLVHRIIKSILKGKKYEFSYPIEQLGEQTSYTERRAEELERKVDSFYKCKYAHGHIGSEFSGYITSVTNFGLFVYIPELMLDGLLHIAELGDDYFIFDDAKQVLVGKKSGMRFFTGQELKVLIAGVDIAKLFIDLMLSDKTK